MIRKFDAFDDTQNGIDNQQLTHCFMSARALVKLNDIVDTINDLTECVKRIDETLVKDGIKPIPTEKIPKQCKWLGKLCWFWDFKRATAIIGVLTDFETDNPQFRKDGLRWYQCCEPVKPNDDIIYQKD